ncbi:MAG: hypothetical protein M0P57_06525 [Syntrophales bacterium]|jgi:hypothetical protein|nr:hypothetical protein [Syntrophales bacterium]MDY0044149.1 hypothetical protein [Syntrophales bacterium]
MDVFLAMKVSVPVFQIAVNLILVTAAILFGKKKLALFISYLFLFYWGYILNESMQFIKGIEEIDLIHAAIYFGFGFLIIILALIGFFQSRE